MSLKTYLLLFLASASLLVAQDAVTSPASLDKVTIPLVSVGSPNNRADWSTHGTVTDTYQIGTYDITVVQYCAFLNAVATGASYTLYHSEMGTDTNVASIIQSGSEGAYSYSVIPGRENMPIVYVSLLDAVRFCNWMENGQLSGIEGEKSLSTGAFNYDGSSWVPNDTTHWSIPTEDEWYKAAYYNPTHDVYWTYPTKSNMAPGNILGTGLTQPLFNEANYNNLGIFSNTNFPPGYKLTPVGFFTGSPGPYGTFDMGGNVSQLTRSINQDGTVVIRGGSWASPTSAPLNANYVNTNNPTFTAIRADVGFRLVYRDRNTNDKPASGSWDPLPDSIKTNIDENPVGNAVNSAFLWQGASWFKNQIIEKAPSEAGSRSAAVEVASGAELDGAAEVTLGATLGSVLALPACLGIAAVMAYYCLPSTLGTQLSIALGGAAALDLGVSPLVAGGKALVAGVRALCCWW